MLHWIKKHFILIIIGLVIFISIVYMRYEQTKSFQLEDDDFIDVVAEQDEDLEQSNEFADDETTFIVDIKGEINRPGVYEVDQSARVNDVIHLAGGFTDEADENYINLAQKVQDEMVIIVPKVGETEDLPMISQTGSTSDEPKVNINQATKEELETLPGIGPAKAQAIIDYREENGMFEVVDDLLQVNGIGEKTLENLRDHIDVR